MRREDTEETVYTFKVYIYLDKDTRVKAREYLELKVYPSLSPTTLRLLTTFSP